MKQIATKEAVGHVLCHDMTQIIPGEYKDARFRKGHVVTEADIAVLLSMGKEHLYVWQQEDGMLHEDEGADRLRALCQGENMIASDPKEGKIEIIADCDGLLLVDVERLCALNSEDDLMVATRHSASVVKKGDKLAGTRIIPLVIEEARLDEAAKRVGDKPILTLKPFKLKTCGLITTGGEVKNGIIDDRFTPVIVDKMSKFGIEVVEHHLPGDDMEAITSAVQSCKEAGVE